MSLMKMEDNCVMCVRQLEHLLSQHDRIVKQTAFLDTQILALDRKIFETDLDGNTTMKTCYERRKFTILGVKIMFNKYKQKKWEQIQEFSNHILQTLLPDGTYPTEPWQTTQRQQNESFTAIEIDSLCSLYRNI